MSRRLRDHIEALVAESFAAVLGEFPGGWDASWFDLGGDSISALHLLGRLRQETGVRIRLADLARHGTVEGVAGVVRANLSAPPRSCLTRHDPRGVPTDTVLAYVHPASGGAYAVHPVAEALGVSVIGVRAAGLEGERPVPRTVADFAAVYLPQLREAAGGRPVWLAGFAEGGVLAYETAAQLRAAGEVVAGVALLDSPAPPLLRRQPARGSGELQRLRLAELLKGAGAGPELAEPSDVDGRPAGIPPAVVAALIAGAVVPPSATGRVVARQLEVFAAVRLAVRDYEPRPGAAPLHFLGTSGSAAAMSFWSGLTPRLVTAEVGVADGELTPCDERVRAVVRRWLLDQPDSV
jgi:thioesterase domain-containing protein/aryl carrier-like protein